jgi:hypothetical protein
MKHFAAIPTEYNGVQMRSRLEARWAAFFDLCGWKWSYEPFDLEGWIPDFMIETPFCEVLVEIKPVNIEQVYRGNCEGFEKALNHKNSHRVLLLGREPRPASHIGFVSEEPFVAGYSWLDVAHYFYRVDAYTLWIKAGNTTQWKSPRAAPQMFGRVTPSPPNVTHQSDAQRALIALANPILDAFLAYGETLMQPPWLEDRTNIPDNSCSFPQLPQELESNPLYEKLNKAIQILLVLGWKKAFHSEQILGPLAVLALGHHETYTEVLRVIRVSDIPLRETAVVKAVERLAHRIDLEKRITGSASGLTPPGVPRVPDHPDDVQLFMRDAGIEARYNSWTQQVEFKYVGIEWTPLTDRTFKDGMLPPPH